MGLLNRYKNAGSQALEAHLEEGEHLLVFARGQLQANLGREFLHARLPSSTKSPLAAVGVTERRVLILAPEVLQRFTAIPPSTVSDVKHRSVAGVAYVVLRVDGQRYRFYASAGFRRELPKIAEALERFAP
jgi:hypothetical protein